MSIKIGDQELKKLYIGDTPVKAVYLGDKKLRPLKAFLDALFVKGAIIQRDGALSLTAGRERISDTTSASAGKSYRTKHIEATFGRRAKGNDQVGVNLHQGSGGTNAPLQLGFRIINNEVVVSCGYTRGNEIRFSAGNGAGEFRASADVRYNGRNIAGVDFMVKHNGQTYTKSYGSHNGRYLVGLPKGELAVNFYTPRPYGRDPYVREIIAE